MSALNDLVAQIEDANLRERIAKEVERLSKQKKFGLVFEEHLPECTPLYDIPVKAGGQVAQKTGKVNDIYKVIRITEGIAECIHRESKAIVSLPVSDLVTVAEFGEPIYPYLKPLDSVCNAPDSDLWHTLIEADNYHALQLLEYLYAGKVDCIYIDPPYNTGAKDWKYNNDYVDGNDAYRHSKWLSFMQKRLKIAKKLLNPKDSVLIVTIDEKEYLHLGCLLEEMFPDASIQMVSSVINHASVARFNVFNRNNEYIFFVMIGAYELQAIDDSKTATEGAEIAWNTLRRHSPSNVRASRPRQFYPIYINTSTNKIEKIGEPISPEVDRNTVPQMDGCVAVFPVRDNGIEMLWGVTPQELKRRLAGGFVKVGKYDPTKPQQYGLQVVPSGPIKQVQDGTLQIDGYREDGSVIIYHKSTKKVLPKTQWDYESHDAKNYGSNILKMIFGGAPFAYPKSIYAVRDSLKLFLANKRDALIIDFFAGSGTTLHSVNLLNMEDGGSRRCIMVTNNEVSLEEAKTLTKEGHIPGDDAWDALGVARNVTWPRTVSTILGRDINGEPLKGSYLDSNKPMEAGFATNSIFFKLGFLDRNSVALGRQFTELLPVLWMKSGSYNVCPEITEPTVPPMLILPQNKFAVLVDERYYMEFVEELDKHPEIETVFIVTDSDAGYRDMISGMEDKHTYQLYKDYLDNFRINTARR